MAATGDYTKSIIIRLALLTKEDLMTDKSVVIISETGELAIGEVYTCGDSCLLDGTGVTCDTKDTTHSFILYGTGTYDMKDVTHSFNMYGVAGIEGDDTNMNLIEISGVGSVITIERQATEGIMLSHVEAKDFMVGDTIVLSSWVKVSRVTMEERYVFIDHNGQGIDIATALNSRFVRVIIAKGG